MLFLKLKPERWHLKAYQSSAFQTIYLTIIAIPELIHLATQGKTTAQWKVRAQRIVSDVLKS